MAAADFRDPTPSKFSVPTQETLTFPYQHIRCRLRSIYHHERQLLLMDFRIAVTILMGLSQALREHSSGHRGQKNRRRHLIMSIA